MRKTNKSNTTLVIALFISLFLLWAWVYFAFTLQWYEFSLFAKDDTQTQKPISTGNNIIHISKNGSGTNSVATTWTITKQSTWNIFHEWFVDVFELEEKKKEKEKQIILNKPKTIQDILRWKWEKVEKVEKNITLIINEINKMMGRNICDYMTVTIVTEEEKDDWNQAGRRGWVTPLYASSDGKWHLVINYYKFKKDQDFELWNAIVHELWHIIDLYVLQGTWAKNNYYYELDEKNKVFKEWDESFAFYDISWAKWKKRPLEFNEGVEFVSWYAKTNPFEDFAETMNLYLNHNNRFLYESSRDKWLAKKYQFFTKLFNNQYFYSGKEILDISEVEEIYDTTTLPYSWGWSRN